MAKIKTIIIALILAIAPALAGAATAHGTLVSDDGKNYKPTSERMLTTSRHNHEEWVCFLDPETNIMSYHYHLTFGDDYHRGRGMEDSEWGDLVAVYIASGKSPYRGTYLKGTFFYDPKSKIDSKTKKKVGCQPSDNNDFDY